MNLADVQDLLERLQRNNELLDDERQEMAKYTEVSRSSYLLTYLLPYLLTCVVVVVRVQLQCPNVDGSRMCDTC